MTADTSFKLAGAVELFCLYCLFNTHFGYGEKTAYNRMPKEVVVALVRVDIETIVVGEGLPSSLIVLRPQSSGSGDETRKLPIRIGTAEAALIGMGLEQRPSKRPMTHDLFVNGLSCLGASLNHVTITGVEGTTFFAQLNIIDSAGNHLTLDSRPSDAIALAIRTHTPIFADSQVIETASYPDYDAVRKSQQREEMSAFHDFVEGLSPEDFCV